MVFRTVVRRKSIGRRLKARSGPSGEEMVVTAMFRAKAKEIQSLYRVISTHSYQSGDFLYHFLKAGGFPFVIIRLGPIERAPPVTNRVPEFVISTGYEFPFYDTTVGEEDFIGSKGTRLYSTVGVGGFLYLSFRTLSFSMFLYRHSYIGLIRL